MQHAYYDELEGVQFRTQREIESQEEMAIVVRDLADVFYEQFAGDIEKDERESPEPGLAVPEDWEGEAEHRTLGEF